MAAKQNTPAAADAAPTATATVIDLVANGELRWGDTVYPDGTLLAKLTLPPGAPFSHRWITRLVEDVKIIAKPESAAAPSAPAADQTGAQTGGQAGGQTGTETATK